MNNPNHAKYIVIWRRTRSGDLQMEEHTDIESALGRRHVLLNLQYVNRNTITIYQQVDITRGEEVTKIVRMRPDITP